MLACLLLLGACASPTISADYRPPPDKQVGLAAGSMTYTHQGNYYRVFVRKVDSAERFRFEVTDGAIKTIGGWLSSEGPELGVRGQPFVTELPAGDYEITGWGAGFGATRGVVELVVGIPFTVESGKTIYLGNFHFAGRWMPFGIGSMSVTLKSEGARDIPVITKQFPALAIVPLRTTVAPGIQLRLVGGYGQITDPPRIYEPMRP